MTRALSVICHHERTLGPQILMVFLWDFVRRSFMNFLQPLIVGLSFFCFTQARTETSF